MKIHRIQGLFCASSDSSQQECEQFTLNLEIQVHPKLKIICLELLVRSKTASCIIEQSPTYLLREERNDFLSEIQMPIDSLHKQIYMFWAFGKNQVREIKCLNI